MIISRPLHKSYALASVSNETYIKFVNGYATAKQLGVKGVWIYVSGSGLYGLCKEAITGEVRRWGRKRLAAGILSTATYFSSPLVPFLTNSSKVIKLANATHTCIAYVFEACEDCTNLAWLPLDFALVGQPVSIGLAGRYVLMGGDSSLLSSLLDDE